MLVSNEMKAEIRCIYQPLNERTSEMRLIRLYPGHCGPAFELAAFSLNDAPKYNALSYCWTEKEACCEISINGRAFKVRPHLYAYLNLMVKEQHWDWIFIDAICINQEDDAEKIHQIKLMGQVYSKASKVIAWISGDQTYTNDCAMLRGQLGETASLDHLVNDFERQWDDPDCSESQWEEHLVLFWSVWRIFFVQKYWSRLWIVQELLLAHDLEIRAGEFSMRPESLISMDDMASGLDWEEKSSLKESWMTTLFRDFSKCDSPEEQLMMYKYSATKVLRFRATMQAQSTGCRRDLGLHDAIAIFSHQDCSKRFDKVFGLLGITSSHIIPHYDISVTELYLRTLNEGIYVGPADGVDDDDRAEKIETVSDDIEDRSNEPIERSLAKIIQFSLILRTALGLSWSDPIITLVTDETFRLWRLQSNTYTGFESFAAFVLSGSKKESIRGIFSLWWAKLRVKGWKCRNNVVLFSGDKSDRPNYDGWRTFAESIYHDVHVKLDADQNCSKDFKLRLEKYLAENGMLRITFKEVVSWPFAMVCSLLSRTQRQDTA